jgi:hypothetical protein
MRRHEWREQRGQDEQQDDGQASQRGAVAAQSTQSAPDVATWQRGQRGNWLSQSAPAG